MLARMLIIRLYIAFSILQALYNNACKVLARKQYNIGAFLLYIGFLCK